MEKNEFYYEVVEKVLQWSNKWEQYRDGRTNIEPETTQSLVKNLIEFENKWFQKDILSKSKDAWADLL
jgi:hypothetical protein